MSGATVEDPYYFFLFFLYRAVIFRTTLILTICQQLGHVAEICAWGKIMKRFSLLMTTLILSVWFSVSAYSYMEVDGIDYFPSSTTTLMVIPIENGYSGDVVIPNSINCCGKEYLVTSIGESAFEGCTGLTSVTIPSTVTSIGNSAFKGCTGLTSVTIPSSVTSIGNSAFEGCNGLTSVTIPSSVTSIGENVLFDCNGIEDMVTVNDVFLYLPKTYSGHYTIPENITRIIGGAFADCTGLTSVTIPSTVTSIGDYAFWDCSSLTSVTIPNSVTSIGDWAFHGCVNLNSAIIANDMLVYMPRTYSGNYSIPGNITRIIGGALADCTGLTSVTIPNSVKSIGGYAFNGCI